MFLLLRLNFHLYRFWSKNDIASNLILLFTVSISELASSLIHLLCSSSHDHLHEPCLRIHNGLVKIKGLVAFLVWLLSSDALDTFQLHIEVRVKVSELKKVVSLFLGLCLISGKTNCLKCPRNGHVQGYHHEPYHWYCPVLLVTCCQSLKLEIEWNIWAFCSSYLAHLYLSELVQEDYLLLHCLLESEILQKYIVFPLLSAENVQDPKKNLQKRLLPLLINARQPIFIAVFAIYPTFLLNFSSKSFPSN